ncbi:conserved hypothetical protein [Burkholderia gladioli]|uniref:hypothetical protein n=1 Tax=Burkholderia gladioli TaxID=28095 RepID=UPI001CB06FDC|nr:hypothetical protein [Burkholderia gladioli]CAG9205605.1 conserved hypothetical protein [Burkholderia gladioli]
MSKVTEWYPASVNPVRDGLYETTLDDGWTVRVQRFQLGEWLGFDIYANQWSFSILARCKYAKWRGLAEKPA